MANYRGKRINQLRWEFILLAAAAVMVLTVAVHVCYSDWNKAPQLPDNSQVPDSPQLPDVTQISDSSQDVSRPGTSASSAGASPDVSPAPSDPPESHYDFSQPAPESEAVDNGYFDDAAFVGDSRTDGFMLYSGIGTGKNLTSNGLSIFALADKKVLTIDGEDYTLLEALAMEEYGKVYLSLGVNELGIYRDKSFYSSYCDAIDQIRLLQPNAVIYIQGLIPVNEEQIEAYNGNKYNLTNEHLRVYNDLMRQAAEEKQVVYLDLYSEFADEDGILPEDVSRDGVHLRKEPCQQWLTYLKSHTVDFDTLYPDGPPASELSEPEEPDSVTTEGSEQG